MTKGPNSGLAILVGAGPGDPQLISVAGRDWLARADVVVYDRLASPALLELTSPRCEHIYVGKEPTRHSMPQQAINELLVEQCRKGRLVVRLKGGDPLIFGRGGEEADALAQAGLAFRIVPGITAAAAAAACAGIPLTDRRLASSVAFVTGHEKPDREESAINWQALAGIDTIVFYMGVGNLPAIAEKLVAAGKSPDTPAAVVQNASLPDQRTLTATLAELPAVAASAQVQPPALVIVGPVASVYPRLAWRQRLPLHGRRVLVTRSRSQSSKLAHRLILAGAEVIEAPTICIEPPTDTELLDESLRWAVMYDWVVFTSPNAVRAVTDRLRGLGLDARALGSVCIAAIGPATAEALAENFLSADLTAETSTSGGLAQSLATRLRATNGRLAPQVLLPRSDLAGGELPEFLAKAGAEVTEVVAYRTVRPDSLPPAAVEAINSRRLDWITFTSSSTVENFFALVGEDVDLGGARLAAIGPVTADALREAGREPTVVAEGHTIEALVAAIEAHQAGDGRQ
jgi:uroporphyrinogen III methyltransferase/synthase